MSNDAFAFHLKFDDAAGGLRIRMAKTPDGSQPELLANDRNAQAPDRQEHLLRFREIVAHGTPPLALVDENLSDGAIARIIVDPLAEEPRLMVASTYAFTDEVFIRMKQALVNYELSTPAESARAEIRIWPNGRVRVESGGKTREFHPRIRMSGIDQLGFAEAIKGRAATLSPRHLNGVGMARLVHLSGNGGPSPR
jgi:hypothetical protein